MYLKSIDVILEEQNGPSGKKSLRIIDAQTLEPKQIPINFEGELAEEYFFEIPQLQLFVTT